MNNTSHAFQLSLKDQLGHPVCRTIRLTCTNASGSSQVINAQVGSSGKSQVFIFDEPTSINVSIEQGDSSLGWVDVGHAKSSLVSLGSAPLPTVATLTNAVTVVASLAPVAQNKVQTIVLPSKTRKIQFFIKNLEKPDGKHKSYLTPLYGLFGLSYILVNTTTGEKLTEKAFFQKAEEGNVQTVPVTVAEGVEVGLLLGTETLDSRQRVERVWYKVTPTEDGLTKVKIKEVAGTSTDQEIKQDTKNKNIFTAKLSGAIWADFCSEFTLAEVEAYATTKGNLLVPLTNSSGKEITKASVDQALQDTSPTQYSDAITKWLHQSYYDANTPLKVPLSPSVYLPNGQKITLTKTTPIVRGAKGEAMLQIPWFDLLKLFYGATSAYTGGDDATDGGQIEIKSLGLMFTFAPKFAENAVKCTGITPKQALARIKPTAYKTLIECAVKTGIRSITIGSTWRPMLGSPIHKEGGGIDISAVTSEKSSFSYNQGQKMTENTGTKKEAKFHKALLDHDDTVNNAFIYNNDDHPVKATNHDDHLHVSFQ